MYHNKQKNKNAEQVQLPPDGHRSSTPKLKGQAPSKPPSFISSVHGGGEHKGDDGGRPDVTAQQPMAGGDGTAAQADGQAAAAPVGKHNIALCVCVCWFFDTFSKFVLPFVCACVLGFGHPSPNLFCHYVCLYVG